MLVNSAVDVKLWSWKFVSEEVSNMRWTQTFSHKMRIVYKIFETIEYSYILKFKNHLMINGASIVICEFNIKRMVNKIKLVKNISWKLIPMTFKN